VERGAFHCGEWASGPVWIAHTFFERLTGLRFSSDGYGMLIGGRSVHSFGLREPLLVIGLGQGRTVIGHRILTPHRVVWIPRAREMLELPLSVLPPLQGAVLTWARGGSTDPVRNTHRQPE